MVSDPGVIDLVIYGIGDYLWDLHLIGESVTMSLQDVVLWVVTLILSAGCIALWIRSYQVLRMLHREGFSLEQNEFNDDASGEITTEIPYEREPRNGTYRDGLTEYERLFAGLEPIDPSSHAPKQGQAARTPSDAA